MSKTTVGKEFRQVFYNQLGFTKDEVREEINKVIEEQVSVILNDTELFEKNLNNLIAEKFRMYLVGELNKNSWRYGESSDKKIENLARDILETKIKQKITELFAEHVKFDIKVSHNTQKKEG